MVTAEARGSRAEKRYYFLAHREDIEDSFLKAALTIQPNRVPDAKDRTRVHTLIIRYIDKNIRQTGKKFSSFFSIEEGEKSIKSSISYINVDFFFMTYGGNSKIQL